MRSFRHIRLWRPLLLALALSANAAPASKETRALAERYNAFAFKLLNESCKELGFKNVFISPASLAVGLAQIETGAHGLTLKEIKDALDIEDMSGAEFERANTALLSQLPSLDPNATLAVANFLTVEKNTAIKPEFRFACKRVFQAEADNVDFKDPALSGKWNKRANRLTHGAIPQLTDTALESALRVIVVNSFYFHGVWADPFDQKLTQDKPFTTAGGERIQHPRMARHGRFSYMETNLFQAVNLPFGVGDASFYVFFPKRGSKDFLGRLNAGEWADWTRGFQTNDGNVELPKFKLNNSYDVKLALTTLGIRRAFEESSDLGGISDQLFLNWASQKTFVDVNEDGADASSVSVIASTTAPAPPQPSSFSINIDRPFFIAIEDNQTGLILYLGVITDPRGTTN